MVNFICQLGLLLWKNFTLRKRQPIRVFVELMWPLVLFLILLGVRLRDAEKDSSTNVKKCYHYPLAMPSAGTLAFLQSYICRFDNGCVKNVPDWTQPGIINNYNTSILDMIVSDMYKVLSSESTMKELVQLSTDAIAFSQMYETLRKESGSIPVIALRDLLYDREEFNHHLTNQSIGLNQAAIDTLEDAQFSWQNALSKTDPFALPDLFKLLEVMNEINQGADPSKYSADVKSIMCKDKFLLEYLIFQDSNKAHQLIDEICSLPDEMVLLLAETLYENINSTIILEEARNLLIANQGELSTKSLSSAVKVLTELQQLETIQLIFQNAIDGVNTIADNLPGESSMDAEVMGNFLCGKNSRALHISKDLQHSLNSKGQTSKKKENSLDKKITAAKERIEKKGISPECVALFESFEKSSVSKVLWHELKPIILGIIPYAPDSPATRKIIKEASKFFDYFKTLSNLLSDFDTVIPELQNIINNGISPLMGLLNKDTCQSLVKLASSPPIQTYLSTLFPEEEIVLEALGSELCDSVPSLTDNVSVKNRAQWLTGLNITREIIGKIQPYIKCIKLDKFVGFKSAAELEQASLYYIGNRTLLAGIVFDNIKPNAEEIPSTVTYTLRLDWERGKSTRVIRDYIKRPKPGDIGDFYIYGFLELQDMLDQAIIRLQTNRTDLPGIYSQEIPYPCYISSWFASSFAETLPLFMALSWLFTVATVIKGIVYEKETRLKEVMRIMGLGNGVHWLAWFITSFIMMFISACIIVLILKMGLILKLTDPSIILLFMLGMVCATISQCFLISVFFNKANLAAVCGGFIFFILYLPYTALVRNLDRAPTWIFKLSCLSPNIAMGFGCYFMAINEEQYTGAQWDNINVSPIVDGLFCLQDCIEMLFADALIYFVLAWYIEIVFPGQYGLPRKPWFFLMKSYWFGASSESVQKIRAGSEMPVNDLGGGSFEAEPTNRQIGVAVRNLSKSYTKGKIAVDGLTINFYEDQITSFLGHNGAGKTTTMSILTGLFPPTAGTAYIYGRDILTDFDAIRNSLGMCPQHNVLFDLLTVEEHIWFYASLKGRTGAEVRGELEVMLEDVGLPHKRHEKVLTLSGGMKRKLSVAIAFVGGSQTVILDEPTAGVDPYARRAIWELLLKLKKNRTIILSTHHMDEADMLGDRIAIISQGKLCTVGSSLFLKNKYGSGYYLTLVRADHSRSLSTLARGDSVLSSKPSLDIDTRKTEDVKVEINGEIKAEDKKFGREGLQVHDASAPELLRFVQQYAPDAKLIEDNSMEICICLPQSQGGQPRQFQQLFAALEASHIDLGISSYGISDTSLEEVFLRVADENADEEVKRSRLEEMCDNGLYPQPISSKSFLGRARQTLLKISSKYRTNSARRFSNEEDDTGVSNGTDCNNGNSLGNASPGQVSVTGKMLILQQSLAILLKRLYHVCRSRKGYICELLLPAAFVCLAMISTLVLPEFSEDPALELQPWMYEPQRGDNSLYSFYNNDNQNDSVATAIEQALYDMPYYGTRCLDPRQHKIEDKHCYGPDYESKHWTSQTTWTNTTPACDCSSGNQVCPADQPLPSKKQLRNHDRFLNISSWNVSQWLMETRQIYGDLRMGGFSIGQKYKLATMSSHQIHNAIDQLVGFERASGAIKEVYPGLKDLETVLTDGFIKDNVVVWQNSRGFMVAPAYINAMNNAILRALLPSGVDPRQYGIVTKDHPIKFSREQLSEQGVYQNGIVNLVVSVCVIFAMSFIPASFVLFLIEERVSKSKHLQFVSGVSPAVYWLANWIWDMLNYSVPALLCLLIFICFDQKAYVSDKNLPCLVALLFMYGWGITPLMYPFSRLFEVPSTAFVTLSCMNVFLGSISTLATFILETMTSDSGLAEINSVLKKVFLIFPHYCLGRGLMDMSSYQLHAQVIERYGETLEYSLFQWDIVGRNLFSLFTVGILFNILNLLLEYKFFLSGILSKKEVPISNANLDVDVLAETERVLSGAAGNDVLRLEGLTKVYKGSGKSKKGLLAVDHLYVGVPKGQCFGLLGVNGAGKTTVFKMLTGDISVTEGDAFICDNSITSNMGQAQKLMGYCPQFDALDPLLTGKEHLEFYARIKGIPASQVKDAAKWAAYKLGLSQYWKRSAGTYSGGNKRKLSTAIALIGNPTVLFLDEPTAGMDPQARRFLWNIISNVVKDGRSVVLTSHSMEECEILCSRLAIMVNGTFQCLGSIQHLKSRFGNGYTVVLRVSSEDIKLKPIMRFVRTAFPTAKLKEKHHNMLQYHIESSSLSLSQLFEVMEEAKEKFGVEDYSVSQTTLDQVFVNFAKQQKDLLDQELQIQNDQNAESKELCINNSNDDFSAAFHTEYIAAASHDADTHSLAGSTIELVTPKSKRRSRQSDA